MQKSELDNANPTILNVSQLPSRRRTRGTARHGPDSKYDHIVFPKQVWPAISSRAASSWPSDEEDDDDDDTPIEEPIDEQEIYGQSPLLSPQICHAARPMLH